MRIGVLWIPEPDLRKIGKQGRAFARELAPKLCTVLSLELREEWNVAAPHETIILYGHSQLRYRHHGRRKRHAAQK
jgi:hypothetical protein